MSPSDHLDELVSRLSAPAPLRRDQIERIRAAIDAPPRRRRIPRLVIVGTASLVLCSFAAAAVYTVASAREPEPAATPMRVETPPPVPAIAPREPATPPVPVVPAPAPPRAPVANRRHVRPPAPAAIAPIPAIEAPPPAPVPQAVDAAPDDAALAAESLLIATSLRQLRKDHAPKAALATLDRYADEFPRGTLLQEARTTRVETLLALGDRRAALDLLDTMIVGTELAVLRGELRLAAGRIDAAGSDFSAALIGAHDDLEARALYGRAACRLQVGDRTGAREDLAAYVRRFPRGTQLAAARAALAGLPP